MSRTDVVAALAIKKRYGALSLVDAAVLSHGLPLECDIETFDERQKAAWQAERAGAPRSRHPM